nr:immunoglobulin heavy chain junction region [Mus musculus]
CARRRGYDGYSPFAYW